MCTGFLGGYNAAADVTLEPLEEQSRLLNAPVSSGSCRKWEIDEREKHLKNGCLTHCEPCAQTC